MKVPAGWTNTLLHHVAEIRTGLSKSARREGPTVRKPYLRVANVQDGFLDLSEIKEIDVPVNQFERFTLKSGDMLLIEGNGNPENLGRGCVWDGQIQDCVHQNHIFAVRTLPSAGLFPSFLALQLQSAHGRNYLLSCAKGSTGLSTLNSGQLKLFPLLLPPIREQQLITDAISSWATAIEKTERLLAEKRLRRKALMQQLLTGKRRLLGFTGEWREYEIGKVFKEVNRPVKWDDDELYDLISVRRRSGGLFHRESLYGRQILTKNLKTAHTGDFLISKMQVLHGATGLVTSEFDSMKISGSYISLVPRMPDKISTDFFSYFSQLPSFYHLTFLASYGVHIEKMTFNTKWFMRSKIFIPPTAEEQQAIANLIRIADRELELLQVKATALREQKKGLMQQLLTGKKRLKCEGDIG